MYEIVVWDEEAQQWSAEAAGATGNEFSNIIRAHAYIEQLRELGPDFSDARYGIRYYGQIVWQEGSP